MQKRIALLCCCLMCFAVAFAAAKGKFVLVIDAGHGGKDAGACSHGAKEKDINLKVALAFGRYVENNCSDVRVIYTRKTDVFVPLHERAGIANRNKADVFISIHTNSVASKKPISGMETYTMGIRRSDEKLSAAQRENEVISYEDDYKQRYAGYDPKSPESMAIFQIMNEHNMASSVELAKLIQKHTCATTRMPNKGVRQDAFLVLRETSMPACLVELGYITTASDRNFLTDRANVDKMGRGIYQAFVAFKNSKMGRAQAAAAASARPAPVAEAAPAPPVGKPLRQETDKPARQKADSPLQVENADGLVANDSTGETPALAGTAEVPTPADKQAEAPRERNAEQPVFKVQILVSDTRLKARDRRLKGLTEVDAFREGGLWKHTVGASANYNEIYSLRKKILSKFPEAFIIAFKDGEKMNVNAAIREFKQNKNK